LKVATGFLRGRRIKSKKGLSTRPLLSRVRKSLFDILGETVKGKRFLDLYAGSGAVGIEALSAGAREAVFVEIDPECVRIIKENLFHCGIYPRTKVYQKDVLHILPFLLEIEDFNFIFIGPPYFKGLQNRTVDIIQKSGNFKGEIIVQHSTREIFNLKREGIFLIEQRKYGDTFLTFLRK